MSIHESLAALTKDIPTRCTLIAVSKTQPLEKISEAYAWGQRVFGENRAQEMAGKYEDLPKDIAWHMIGHLQTNKVKYIAPFVSLIHSVDSFRLLEEISRQGLKVGRIIGCLLQVHIAEEEAKFGFSDQELLDLISSARWEDLQNARVAGLMGMATLTENEQQVRKEFRKLKTLFDLLRSRPLPEPVKMEELSMGMSGDFKIAIEEGSTMVRIGTAVFGQRQ
ncbi:MAG: YggS family pyridoxal phosphate-dependent enzyme [Cyclobacteriaceae bacterium]